MKINEIYKEPLTKFKQKIIPSETSWHIVMDNFLQNYGFKRLGRGLFSNVYEHPKLDYILKIFNTYDKGYRTFLSYAIQKNSPYLPKFRGKPMKINETYSAIRMEKLILIPSTERWYNTTKKQDSDIIKNISNFFNFRSYEYESENFQKLKKEIENDYPGLVEILMDIGELMKRTSGISFDIGYLNIMMRPESETPVIIDPFVGMEN